MRSRNVLERKYDEWKGLYRPMLLPGGVVEVQMIVSSRGGMLPGMEPAMREA